MATILTKKSDTASSVPTSGALTNSSGGAEIAVNTADKRLFTKDSGGSVVELGTNPSSLSLPNGTANAVPYLNGSKVLTSGSALTFDGTSLGLGGFGAISSGRAVGVYDNTTARLVLRNATTGNTATDGFEIAATGSNVFISNKESGYIAFENAGSEAMRLTSTGLGIGTSSISEKLTVNGNVIVPANSFYKLGSGNYLYSDGSNTVELAAGTSGKLNFVTNGASRAVIDSSGNLGLGVTPSAWATSTGTQALQIGSGGVSILGGGSGWSAAAFMYLSNNAYYSSSAWRYLRSVPAAQYVQASGEHQWFNAGYGTAGNAISFTQAMTLDASGNLGIGTTSPASRLAVSGGGVTIGGFQSGSGSTLELGFDGTQAIVQGYNRTGSAYLPVWIESSYTRFGTGGGERARIDSSGNLLVGRTSDSDLTVGTTISSAGWIRAVQTATKSVFTLLNSTGALIEFRYATTSAAAVGSISTNGTTTAYNTSSDYRLKNTIAPMTGALAKVAALKPCTYKWNADGSDGEGFIAHELAEVVPQCVTGEKDAVDADGNPVYQGIDTSFLVATLTAAIQELKAEFDAYKATHP